MTDARISGGVVETVVIPTPDLRISGGLVEIVVSNTQPTPYGIVAAGAPTTEIRRFHPDGVARVLRNRPLN